MSRSLITSKYLSITSASTQPLLNNQWRSKDDPKDLIKWEGGEDEKIKQCEYFEKKTLQIMTVNHIGKISECRLATVYYLKSLGSPSM